MSEGRKTKPITFNIKDRGRKFTGISRDNVDIQAWINVINSPATQELVATGAAIGFYGHQLRMLYGLEVPETVIANGKQVSISPAVRTIELRCDADGNVTHRQEFLQTPEGDMAMRNYKNKIGGFSAVNDYKKVGGTIYPTITMGFDYVLQPNYATNIGDGELLLDGMYGDQMRQELEHGLAVMYDSIHALNFANYSAEANLERALASENALLEMQLKQERRRELQQIKQDAMYDSALCPTVSLDEYLSQGREFMTDSVVQDIGPKEKTKTKTVVENITGWFGFGF